MKHTARLSLLLIVVLLALSLAGLNTRQVRAAAADTIVIGIIDKVASMDNQDGYTVPDWEVMKQVGEGLLRFEPGTTNLQPGLAVDMPKISADGKTYTFTLRDGLKFSDGTPLDAQTYADSVNRASLGGNNAGLFTAYVAKVEATDAKTIVFTLKDTYGFFLSLIAGCPPYFPSNPKIFPKDKLVLFPEKIDGIGPYNLTSFKAGEQWTYDANPSYHGDKPKTSHIIVRVFGKPEQLSAAVEKGEIDLAWRGLSPVDVGNLKKTAKDLTIYPVPGGRLIYLAFNHPTKPFDNPQVRQAIASAIDRDEINDRVYNGLVTELYSMVPPGTSYATTSFKDVYGSRNLDQAKKLLAAAGYTADKPLQLELWYPPEHYGVTLADVMQVVKKQVEETGLAKVGLKSQEWATYTKAATKGQYGLYLYGWFPDYLDPDNFLSPFAASDQDKDIGTLYKSDDMDKFLHGAAASADPKVRADLYKKAQDLYAKDVVTVPLFLAGEYTVSRPGVTGADKIGAAFEFNYSELAKK